MSVKGRVLVHELTYLGQLRSERRSGVGARNEYEGAIGGSATLNVVREGGGGKGVGLKEKVRVGEKGQQEEMSLR